VSARTFGSLSLEAVHTPDFSIENDGDGNKKRVELPGHVDFYIVIDGARVRVGRKAAAGLFADIDRAKKAADAAAPPRPPAAPAPQA
jgi:hypothetical protein